MLMLCHQHPSTPTIKGKNSHSHRGKKDSPLATTIKTSPTLAEIRPLEDSDPSISLVDSDKLRSNRISRKESQKHRGSYLIRSTPKAKNTSPEGMILSEEETTCRAASRPSEGHRSSPISLSASSPLLIE